VISTNSFLKEVCEKYEQQSQIDRVILIVYYTIYSTIPAYILTSAKIISNKMAYQLQSWPSADKCTLLVCKYCVTVMYMSAQDIWLKMVFILVRAESGL